MRNLVVKWKIAIILIGIVILSGITIFLMYPRFMEKDFQSEIEIPLNETFNKYDGVCYGNFFSCEKVEEYLNNKVSDWKYHIISNVLLSKDIKPLYERYDKAKINEEIKTLKQNKK